MRKIKKIVSVILLSVFIVGCSNNSTDTYDFLLYEETLSLAQSEYELYVPGFSSGSYGEFVSTSVGEPRYELFADGVYKSDVIEKDGIATIMLTGDLMCQGRQQEVANNDNGFDFTDNFTYVTKMFDSADFVVGNLECTLSEDASLMMEEPKVEDAIHCNAPSTFLDAVQYAGFDMLMTANNHCLDTGLRGLFQTYAHLEQYGFIHTGTFIKETESRFKMVEIDGIKVAFMSYTMKFNSKNDNLTKEGQDIFLNEYSQERVEMDVKDAKAQGAEFIIAYNHWGQEYKNEMNDTQLKSAQEMADAGVDYIIGSHPHALQPYAVLTAIDGRRVPVAYSLGNFVSHMTKTVSKETIVLQVELARDENQNVYIKSEGYIPCRTFKTFLESNYTTIPITAPYSDGHTSKYFADAYEHITTVMGDEIQVLGEFDQKRIP